MTIPAEILAELEALRDSFRQDATHQVCDVTAKWADLRRHLSEKASADTRTRVETLVGDAHRLAGTAATFALGAIAAAAQALELHLAAALEPEVGFRLDVAIGDRLVDELVRATR